MVSARASWDRTLVGTTGTASQAIASDTSFDYEEVLPYWNEHAEGGHFPAMEVPDLLVGDLRAFFAGVR